MDCRLKGMSPISSRKHRAAVGLLQLADAPVAGPGKGAFLVAEKLTLQQGFGNRHAVDHQKRIVGPVAVLVDGPGHQFLARPGFPADQDRGAGGRNPPDGLVDLLHGRAAADDGLARGLVRRDVDIHRLSA